MPIQYLLPCSCGRKTPVEMRQAGEAMVCDCGAKLEIPRLLELKRLEKVVIQAVNPQKTFTWGVGYSVLLSGVVVLMFVAVLWWWVLKTTVRDASDEMTPERVRAYYQKISPLDTWVWWNYFRDNGISPRKDRFERYMEGEFAKRGMYFKYLGVLAAGGVALVVGGVLMVRRKRPNVIKPLAG